MGPRRIAINILKEKQLNQQKLYIEEEEEEEEIIYRRSSYWDGFRRNLLADSKGNGSLCKRALDTKIGSHFAQIEAK